MQVRVDTPAVNRPSRPRSMDSRSPSSTRSRSRTPTGTTSHSADRVWIERRSSYHAQQAPVPAIPARFLQEVGSEEGASQRRRDPPSVGAGKGRTGSCARPRSAKTGTATTSQAAGQELGDSRFHTHLAAASLPRRGGGGISRGGALELDAEDDDDDHNGDFTRRGGSSTHQQRRRSSTRLHAHDATLAHLTSSSPTNNENMALPPSESSGDLFLQLADSTNTSSTPSSNSSLAQRVPNRASPSILGKRKTLRASTLLANSGADVDSDNDRRPRTANAPPTSRARAHGMGVHTSLDMSRFRTPRAGSEAGGGVRAHSDRALRYSVAGISGGLEASPLSPSRLGLGERIRSPEMPIFGRQRASLGAGKNFSKGKTQQGPGTESPNDESESQQNTSKVSSPESDSVDSQTAPSTVWDELSDLKSRIKALEVTGKLPPTSSANKENANAHANQGSSSTGGAANTPGERPRTATTAPTTIDSSPKATRKPSSTSSSKEKDKPAPAPSRRTAETAHPTLHAALQKAQTLLTPPLFRVLEATASDALALAALTNNSGPQGAAFGSAASVLNGGMGDRQARRKADSMCRNLTDLCLALCDGKHESPLPGPVGAVADGIKAPVSRYSSRASLQALDSHPSEHFHTLQQSTSVREVNREARPMSRLEARRASVFGPSSHHPSTPSVRSPRLSASATFPSSPLAPNMHSDPPTPASGAGPLSPEQRRAGRARAGSRLSQIRTSQRFEGPVSAGASFESSSGRGDGRGRGGREGEFDVGGDTEEDEPTVRRSSLAPPMLSRRGSRFGTERSDAGAGFEEDDGPRPVSRAATDFVGGGGNSAWRRSSGRFAGGGAGQIQRSPRESTSFNSGYGGGGGLREGLALRRAAQDHPNGYNPGQAGREDWQPKPPRMSSFSFSAGPGPNRRFARDSTPPVLENETSEYDSSGFDAGYGEEGKERRGYQRSEYGGGQSERAGGGISRLEESRRKFAASENRRASAGIGLGAGTKRRPGE